MSLFAGKLAELKHYLTTSDRRAIATAREAYRRLEWVSLPVPGPMAKVALSGYLVGRKAFHYGRRLFIAQPLFEAHCAKAGKRLRTGSELHWIEGQGDIIVGDDVWFDGRSTIIFASSFSARPTLEVGNNTMIGHDTSFTIARRITIGNNCQISGSSRFFDSSGHATDAAERARHQPPLPHQVRPITIGDDVWVAKQCIVFPGVTIGKGAIISAGSVLRESVPPYSLVAGNPARVVRELPRPSAGAGESIARVAGTE
jgi:acetyltransferase-like isoleucine patch superfamily enzyme